MSCFQWGREDGHQVFIQSRLINSGDLGWKIWTLGKIIRNITSSSSNSEWPAFRLKQLHHRVLQRGTFQNSGLVLSLTNHHPIVFNGGWVSVILEVAEASDGGHWGTLRISGGRKASTSRPFESDWCLLVCIELFVLNFPRTEWRMMYTSGPQPF